MNNVRRDARHRMTRLAEDRHFAYEGRQHDGRKGSRNQGPRVAQRRRHARQVRQPVDDEQRHHTAVGQPRSRPTLIVEQVQKLERAGDE